ncbi:cytochrome b/b6 domain-containing protein [Inmirania thermothiophila]|uniref:Cytochrome b n=1 Tax=Inmirania thermothiophila TaxID=1750597 RepID=A0A3N1Y804_9GAMM|nr:cytochrome b/b6 domain-containing protein [Inmirania thermothiophila]ROR34641.1 cytochrome b [Inmirania thermothiophila]
MTERAPPAEVTVWDPLVRILHWSLVLAYALAWASAETLEGLHVAVGYLVGGIVALRLLWGLVGTRHARFRDFVRPPREAIAYLRALAAGDPPHHLGHNPAGGWSVVLMLATLALVVASGLAALEPGGAGEAAEELHEFLAGLSLFLVLLHLGGVLLSSLLGGENLVRAMWTGRKRAGPGGR